MDESVCVAAIDFGTTFSGYAFAFSGSEKIFLNTNWSAGGTAEYYKTPTSVLTEIKGESHTFIKFGFEAHDTYSKEVKKRKSLCLFEEFKMELHQSDKLGVIRDKTGKIKASAEEIFMMALRYIKDHVMEHFTNQGRPASLMNQIAWVLTVPAIWDDKAKIFMRRVAFKAGLIEKLTSERLCIALEPEAASLYCRKLDIANYEGQAAKDKLNMPTGTLYLVLDAGGGTVDITVHEVLRNGFVREILEPTGGPWGGANVNKAFWKLLENSFYMGTDFFGRLKKDAPHIWWDVHKQFEHKKVTSNPHDRNNLNIFMPPVPLVALYQKVTKKDMTESIEEKHSMDVFIDEDDYTVSISANAMKTLFSDTVDKIEQHVQELLQKAELKRISYLLMVGGFSKSLYLSERIKNSFGARLKIFVPQDSALAIMKGAVLFGRNKNRIRDRKARKTYGVSTMIDYNRSEHRPNKKIIIEGNAKCKDIFKIYVRKGDSITRDQEVIECFAPKKSDSTSISFSLLSINSSQVMYTDDPGVEEIGYIEMPLSDTSRGKKRQAEVKMKFGDTEIKVTAKEKVFSEDNKTMVCKERNLVICNPGDAWYSTVFQTKEQL